MREEAYAALRRYEAMTGRLEGIPEADALQAESDRERHGERSLWRGADGRIVWNDLMAMRFLVEVCGLSLGESLDAAIENSRVKGVRMPDNMPPPDKKAKELFAESGNVLEAHAMAAFWRDAFADDSAAARYWRDVLSHIETARFTREDSGLANWE